MFQSTRRVLISMGLSIKNEQIPHVIETAHKTGFIIVLPRFHEGLPHHLWFPLLFEISELSLAGGAAGWPLAELDERGGVRLLRHTKTSSDSGAAALVSASRSI